jgi:hypothetical protein
VKILPDGGHVLRRQAGPRREIISLIVHVPGQAGGNQCDLMQQGFGQHRRDFGRFRRRTFQLEPQIEEKLLEREQVPATAQHRPEFFQLVDNAAELLGRRILQRLLPQPRQIDAVEHVLEQLRLAFEPGPEIVEHGMNGLGVIALDHHHDIFGDIAEFLRVADPAAVILGPRIDQVGAARSEFEPLRRVPAGRPRQ